VHKLHACLQPRQTKGQNIWILKPSCLSRGRGIYLLDNVQKAVCDQPSVLQRYVAEPLLLHGHKFDIRLYACVTSFNPLEAFVYQVCSESLSMCFQGHLYHQRA
jgi:tubulin polyglutamylase TTLL2